VDPRAIGRLVDVTASPDTVTVRCDGQVVAEHPPSWARQRVITDPGHAAAAAQMRQALAATLDPVIHPITRLSLTLTVREKNWFTVLVSDTTLTVELGDGDGDG
jgi:hypothetical protein